MKQMFLMSLTLFSLFSGSVMAEPKNGLGINIGATSHVLNSTYTVASGSNSVGSTYSYNSSGASLGVDYQIVYPNNLTLNPFVMLSSETSNITTQTNSSISHNILGLQGRSWKGDLYVGVHGAIYTESISSSSGTTTTSETGTGEGIVVGWEPSNSNWSIMLQGDSAKIKYTGQDVNWTGARLSVGYRFK